MSLVEARVYINKEDNSDNYIANAFAQINNDDSGKNYIEIAEETAVGQALTDAGFGVQFCKFIEGNKEELIGLKVLQEQSITQNQTASDEQSNNSESQDQQNIKINPENQSVNPVNTQQPQSSQQEQPAVENQSNILAQQQQLKQELPKQQYATNTPVEEIVKVMTVDEAKNIEVPSGIHRGKTFGQLAIERPGAIEYYINKYNGNDNILRAGATVLINAATKHTN